MLLEEKIDSKEENFKNPQKLFSKNSFENFKYFNFYRTYNSSHNFDEIQSESFFTDNQTNQKSFQMPYIPQELYIYNCLI